MISETGREKVIRKFDEFLSKENELLIYNKANLEKIKEFILSKLLSEKLIDDNLSYFGVFDDGQLLLEWFTKSNPTLDIDSNNLGVYFHMFGEDENEDIELDLNILNENGWDKVLHYLKEGLSKG